MSRPLPLLLPAVAMVVAGAAGCTREVGVELDHQPPLAVLAGPSQIEKGQPAEFTVDAKARDGSIRSYTFEVNRQNVDSVAHEVRNDPSFTFTFDKPDVYYVSVVVADDQWATARASLPVRVVPSAADDKTAPTVALELKRGSDVLAEGAGVSFGDKITIGVTAKDEDTGVAALDVHARLGGSELPLDQASPFKPSGNPKSVQYSFALDVPTVAGELVIEARATDAAAPPNQSEPASVKLAVSAKDSDGDGMPDSAETGGCTDPNVFNGLAVGVWPLSPFPKALCWVTPRPGGETIFGQVTSSAPAYSTRVTTGLLSQSGSGAIGSVVPGAPAAVAALTSFALYYTGKLCLPSGAATLEVEAMGEDVAVIVVDGQPRAANDVGLGCTSFWSWGDFSYVGTKASIKVDGMSTVPIGLLVANESGSWKLDAKLTVKDAGGTVLPVTFDQKTFQAP